MTNKKDLITQEEIDQCIKNNSSNDNKSNQEQLSKLLQEMRITLDDPTFEDSIDGTRIRATCIIEISRKGKRGGEQGEDSIKFQYIKETYIDYGKMPIRIREEDDDDGNDAAYHNNVTQ